MKPKDREVINPKCPICKSTKAGMFDEYKVVSDSENGKGVLSIRCDNCLVGFKIAPRDYPNFDVSKSEDQYPKDKPEGHEVFTGDKAKRKWGK